MSLEALIRDCAARGEMVHLSLWWEPTKKRWCATYSPSHLFGVSKSYDDDPVTATVKALEGIKHARTRARNVITAAPEQDGRTEAEPEANSTDAGGTCEGATGEGVRPDA